MRRSSALTCLLRNVSKLLLEAGTVNLPSAPRIPECYLRSKGLAQRTNLCNHSALSTALPASDDDADGIGDSKKTSEGSASISKTPRRKSAQATGNKSQRQTSPADQSAPSSSRSSSKNHESSDATSTLAADSTAAVSATRSNTDCTTATATSSSTGGSANFGNTGGSALSSVFDATASRDNTAKDSTVTAARIDSAANALEFEEIVAPVEFQRPSPPAKVPRFSQLLDKGKKKPKVVPGFSMTREEAMLISQAFRDFDASASVKNQALQVYINKQLFDQSVPLFRRFLLRAMNPDLRDALLAYEPGAETQKTLFAVYHQYVMHFFGKEVEAFRELVMTADMRKPHLLYPFARALKRQLHYHLGPTNSGKTYTALQALREADSGVYCGPLRLLAMEVYDTLNMDGTFCNLVTGQDKKEIPGSEHTSCTVEMVNMQRRVDVAVIDEIQMIGDKERGWAWTRALQGIPANEIHLCGDGSALPLVRHIAQQMGEKLHVHKYTRFTPLTIDEKGLPNGYLDVQPGDCIVAFARKDIYVIKEIIESETGYRVCVIYGALPPETRRQQARLFNEVGNGYDILVASDAVGMGLNLNIRRIIFHTLYKFDAGGQVRISASSIKQIAGRAGRRNSSYDMGYVTCLDREMLPALKEGLIMPMEKLQTEAAGLFPEYEQLEIFASQLADPSFETLLSRFTEAARLDGTYFLCKQYSTMQLARLLDKVTGLSLEARYNFCTAPVNARDYRLLGTLLSYARRYRDGQIVSVDALIPSTPPITPEQLRKVETEHQLVSLWLWLSFRFGEPLFTGREYAEAKAAKLVQLMAAGLEAMTGEALRSRRLAMQAQESNEVDQLLIQSMDGSMVRPSTPHRQWGREQGRGVMATQPREE